MIATTECLARVMGSRFLCPLVSANIEICQTRGRKRGRQKLSNAEKLARRQKKEEKLAMKKTFMQRMQMESIRNAKGQVYWPPRYDAASERDLDDNPPFNVFFTEKVKTRFYPIAEAMEMHRRLQSPEIYGCPDALLKLRLELNMNTDKATKFITDSRQLVAIPHPFKHKEKRTILAFAQSKEKQEEAMSSGADMVLGPESIKKILKGQFMLDDYDFCIAEQAMAHAILPLRGVLKTRFPTKINGGIGEDLKEILVKFLAGVNIVIKANLAFPQWGLSEPIVGRLNMPAEQIAENIGTLVSLICQQRNPALGPFINRALLMTVPGKAYYSIDISAWEPKAEEEDFKKLEKRKRKKKKKEKKEVEEENNSLEKEDLLINVM